jgi:Zn-dependent protease with chaperone function
MSLVHVLLVISTIAWLSLPSGGAGSIGLERWLPPIGLSIGIGLLGKSIALVLAAGWDSGHRSREESVQIFLRWHQALLWVWLGLLPVLFGPMGWGETARSGCPEELSRAGLLCLAWLPTAWLLIALDTAAYQLQVFLGSSSASSGGAPNLARESGGGGSWGGWWRYQRRSASLTWLLPWLPAVLMAAIIDVAGSVAHHGLTIGWWLPLLVWGLLSLSLRFPQLLCRLWGTEPLTSGGEQQRRLAERLNAVWQGHGLTPINIQYWPTGLQTATAVVVGWWRPTQRLVISDALVAALTPLQLEMVIRHEAAHVSGRHALQRLAVLAAGVAAWGMGHVGLGEPWWTDQMMWGLAAMNRSQSAWGVVCLIGTLGLLSWLARVQELWADAAAVRSAAVDDRITPNQARAELGEALRLLCGPSRGGGWLHPRLSIRLESLRTTTRPA